MPEKWARAKTLDDTRKHQSASIKPIISGADTFVSSPVVKENRSFCKTYQPSVPFAKELQKHYEVWLSLAHPSDVVSCVTTNCADRRPDQTCQDFGINCLKLDEFKQGDPSDLLFSSKALIIVKKLHQIKFERKYFGVVLDETHCVVIVELSFFFQLLTDHEKYWCLSHISFTVFHCYFLCIREGYG